MKHTEKYLQAKWVTQNPEGYDERDVIDAKRYCNAYLEGYSQALSIANVVGQSEQLPCDCNVKLAETTLQIYCPKCYKTHKMK